MKNLSFADLLICIVVSGVISFEILTIVLCCTDISRLVSHETLDNITILLPFAVYLLVLHILSLSRYFRNKTA